MRSQAHSKQESLERCVPRVRLCGCHVCRGEMEEGQAGRAGRGGEGILFVLFENMSQRVGKKEEVEEKITTRMDGGSTERGNNRREHELGA